MKVLLFYRYNICRCTHLKIVVAPVVSKAELMGYLPDVQAGVGPDMKDVIW
jgi:hypothetical protein